MRTLRFVVLCSALLVSGGAVARASVAPPEAPGSLAVSDATGTLGVHGDGVIFGVVGQGSLVLASYRPTAPGAAPAVSGATAHVEDGLVVYSGADIRFLLPEGRYTIQTSGGGIDLSAVGKGSISIGALPDTSLGAPAPGGLVALDGANAVPFSAFVSPGLFSPHAVSS